MKKKRIVSMVLSLFMMLGMFSLPVFAEDKTGAGLKVTSNGTLQYPGDKIIYSITKEDGSEFTDLKSFTDHYSVSKNLKVPLYSTEVVFSNNKLYFTVGLYTGTKASASQPYSGTVTFKNLDNDASLNLDIKGTLTSNIIPAQTNINIKAGKNSDVYEFNKSLSSYNITFGKDALLTLNSAQSGTKVLAYNIDPVEEVVNKYGIKVGDNYGFINFPGNPKFESAASVKLFIPVSGSTPILYRVKSDSSDGELEELTDVKVGKSGDQSVFEFTTDQLASTYVIASTKITTVKSTASASTNNGVKIDENNDTPVSNAPDDTASDVTSSEPTTTVSANDNNLTKDESSPKTGSNETRNIVGLTLFAAACALCIVSAVKNKKNK